MVVIVVEYIFGIGNCWIDDFCLEMLVCIIVYLSKIVVVKIGKIDFWKWFFVKIFLIEVLKVY